MPSPCPDQSITARDAGGAPAARRLAGPGAVDAVGRRLVLVRPTHPLRSRVEESIAAVYEKAFGAGGLGFPDLLVALLDTAGEPIAGAGFRTAGDGFFSEAYLDAPIERLLAERCGGAVARAAIFEVTTLATRRAAAVDFVRRLAALGQCAGFGWSFFTATGRLRRLLGLLGMPVLELAAADPRRLADAARWGRYYAHSPLVCAVSDPWPAGGRAGLRRRWRDA
jgi:Thermostable hemolysin